MDTGRGGGQLRFETGNTSDYSLKLQLKRLSSEPKGGITNGVPVTFAENPFVLLAVNCSVAEGPEIEKS